MEYQEQSHEFEERLSQWIASQGFWFQLRHSISGGGGWSMAVFHLVRMTVRVLILLALVGVGFGVYLVKRVGSDSFMDEIRGGFTTVMSAKSAEIVGFSRSPSGGSIRRIGAEGSSKSFFESFEAGNLKFDMSLLDGMYGAWDAGVIQAQWVDVEVKAGANSPEDAAAAGVALFDQRDGFAVQGLDVSEARISWGYSERGYGGIQGSKMKVIRVGDGWRFSFTGGTFSQNWIRDFEIVELEMLCSPGELVVEKGRLKAGNGVVEFRDVRVEGGEEPVLSGIMALENIPLEMLVPSKVSEIVSGSISGEFELGGSTNSAEGVTLAGTVKIADPDSISVRDELPLFAALDVVDVFHNYKRVDFERGEFKMETGGGELRISGLTLDSRELMTLEGRLSVRRPKDEEVSERIGMSAADAALAAEEDMKDAANMEITLREAAKSAKQKEKDKDKKEDGEGKNTENTKFFADIGETRQLRREAMDRARNMLVFDGGFRMMVPGDAFERSRALRERFPVDQGGRIGVDVPLQGTLSELTLRQGEDILRINLEDR